MIALFASFLLSLAPKAFGDDDDYDDAKKFKAWLPYKGSPIKYLFRDINFSAEQKDQLQTIENSRSERLRESRQKVQQEVQTLLDKSSLTSAEIQKTLQSIHNMMQSNLMALPDDLGKIQALLTPEQKNLLRERIDYRMGKLDDILNHDDDRDYEKEVSRKKERVVNRFARALNLTAAQKEDFHKIVNNLESAYPERMYGFRTIANATRDALKKEPFDKTAIENAMKPVLDKAHNNIVPLADLVAKFYNELDANQKGRLKERLRSLVYRS